LFMSRIFDALNMTG